KRANLRVRKVTPCCRRASARNRGLLHARKRLHDQRGSASNRWRLTGLSAQTRVFVFGFEHGKVLVIAHLVSFWVGFAILAFVFRRRRKSIAARLSACKPI